MNIKTRKISFIIITVLLIVGCLYFGISYWQKQKAVAKKNRAKQKQDQVMQDFWKQKGLSEEEINNKSTNKTKQMKQKKDL